MYILLNMIYLIITTCIQNKFGSIKEKVLYLYIINHKHKKQKLWKV
jgi:hypothetical protein